MDNKDSFSERLTELMFQADKITTEKLGNVLSVGGSTVCLWKEGKRGILLSNAIKIVEYFNCSLEFLFGRTDNVLDFAPQAMLPFYNELKKIMKERNISMYRIVKEKIVSSGNFDSWSKGGDPFMQTVIKLADYLDVTIDYLVGRDR